MLEMNRVPVAVAVKYFGWKYFFDKQKCVVLSIFVFGDVMKLGLLLVSPVLL